MNNKPNYIFRISVLILQVCFFVSCQPSMSKPALINSRQVTTSTLNLIEQWRIKTAREDYSADYPPPLVIIGDKVIIGFDIEREVPESWIEALSLTTGQVLWKSLFQGNISTNFHDTERFYVTSASYLASFRISDGKLLWDKDLTDHQSYWFLPWNPANPLHLYTTVYGSPSDDELIRIDPETGTTLSTEVIDSYIQYDRYKFVYAIEGLNRSIRVVDATQNQEIWYRQIDSTRTWQPQVVADNLFYFDDSVISKLSCVHIPTGENCWQTADEFISNHSIVGETIYALNDKGVLIALDVETGQEQGRISFTDPPPQDPGGCSYWVAANEDYVLVYFGDSLLASEINGGVGLK